MSHGAGEDPARAGNFIHTIDRLCRRPVHSEGVQDSPHVVRPPFLHTWREQRVRQHTKRRGIPLVRLRGSDGWPAVLVPPRGPAPDERPVTHVVSRGIPRACPAVEPGEQVPEILGRVVAALREEGTPRLCFPRYGLAKRVMDRLTELGPPPPGPPDAEREELVRQLLREVERTWRADAVDGVADTLPFPFNTLLAVLPGFVRTLRLSGRMPGLSGGFRWLRQRLAHDGHRSLGVVPMLARFDAGDPGAVGGLLLGAFMDDLARQYLRGPLHLRGAARVFYPLLLLNEHCSPLIELLRERRQDVHLFDPVVVVSYESGQVEPDDEEDPLWALIRWRRELVTAKDDAAWRLMITTPLVITAPPVPSNLSQFDVGYPHWVPPARTAPWWSSWTAITLFWVALAGAAGAYVGKTLHWQHYSCVTGPWAPWIDTGRERLGQECVGVADQSHLFMPDDDRLVAIQERIHQANEDAAKAHEDDAGPDRRPYVTLVYLAALSSPDGDRLAAARERLAGVAVAQITQNANKEKGEPLIRLLLANGGSKMQYGKHIPALLTRHKDAEAPIVGVVGLDQSRQATVETIKELGKAGLPMVAATLSADRLVKESEFYFQVAPRNSRQAAVAAAFADRLADEKKVSREARVYSSQDHTDYYSTNLGDQVAARLQDQGFTVSERRFVPEGGAPEQGDDDPADWEGTPREAGQDACSYGGLVYFAGRGLPDFHKFVQGVHGTCPGGEAPTILGGDDVTRYMAEPDLRKDSDVSFYHQAFALGAAACGTGPFYEKLHKQQPCKDPRTVRTLDGHAAMSYDAAQTMIEAIRRLGEHVHPVPIDPATVWRQLSLMHEPVGSSVPALAGLTGDIGSDVKRLRQHPKDKPVLILRAADLSSSLVGHCGDLPGQAESAWCAGIADRYR